MNISGLTTLSEGPIRKLIAIEPGDAFSLHEVDVSIAYLRKWGVFDAISVDPSMTEDGVILDYHLEEATVIAAIDISGNYPYLENKVRKHLTLHAGDIYTPEKLEEQLERIKEFYNRQGYLGTEVYVEEESQPDVNGVGLTFHIRRGELLRYRRIEVEGNRAFPKGKIVSEINPYLPFSERRLRRSLRELREAYQRKGYPRARIKLASKQMDFEALRVDLAIAIDEGPHVDVRFVGSPHTSRALLKRTITLLKDSSIDRYEIETSAVAIRNLLISRGHPDAQVRWERSELPDGTIVITFLLDEGPSKRIKRLRFSGDEHISEKDLAAGMQNKQMAMGERGAFLPDEQSDDDQTIEMNLKRRGFLDANIDEWIVKPTPQGYALDITIPLDEGPQTIVQEIRFEGNESIADKPLLETVLMKPGKPLDEPGLPKDEERLKNFFADNGHPYASVAQQVSIDQATHNAVITYTIEEGPLVRIGSILIVGDVLTSQRAIKRAMEIKEGEPFSYRKIVNSQLNIRRLGAFAYVSIETIGISERRQTIPLKIKIEEQRPFLIDLALNYSTDESLTGTLAFTNINAFGWAKTNSLRLTAGKDLSRAEIIWLDPRFLGTSLEMSSAAWIQYKQKPAYTYIQLAGGLGWAKRFSRFGAYFWYEIQRNYFVEGDSTAADADSLRDNTISKISLSANYDSRDSFSYPTKGFYTIGGSEIFNEIRGNNANYVKLFWKGESDLSFTPRLVFSTSLRIDQILGIGSNVSVPTSDLLFLGGDDTIRGFGQDSLGPTDANGNATGSRARWIVNEEVRLRLFGNFGVAAFYDMGSLTPSFGGVTTGTVRKSAGLGLRYTTPVGPLRLDYGFKLDRRAGESIGRLHFTFGYLF